MYSISCLFKMNYKVRVSALGRHADFSQFGGGASFRGLQGSGLTGIPQTNIRDRTPPKRKHIPGPSRFSRNCLPGPQTFLINTVAETITTRANCARVLRTVGVHVTPKFKNPKPQTPEP